VSAETDHGSVGSGARGAAPAGDGVRPSPATPAEPSVGELVRDASEQLSALMRAEFELAKAELSATVKRAGVGAGFIVVAVGVILLGVPFLLVAFAEGLVALGLPRWSAYLIVGGLFIVMAVVLALVGVQLVRRLRKPERTIETVKQTARWARHPTSGSGPTGAAGAPAPADS
jgi:hypothetical protein